MTIHTKYLLVHYNSSTPSFERLTLVGQEVYEPFLSVSQLVGLEGLLVGFVAPLLHLFVVPLAVQGDSRVPREDLGPPAARADLHLVLVWLVEQLCPL